MPGPLIGDTGNVYFQKGILKSITKDEVKEFNRFVPYEEKYYSAALFDGTKIEFRKQVQTNRASIEMKGDTIVFNGIRDFNLAVPENGTGIYKLNGCKGFVDVYENRRGGDSVFTSDRKFPDGLKQESELSISSNNMDNIKISEDDIKYPPEVR